MDFWQKASEALRAHALAFVGRALKQTGGNITEEIMERLKQLWEWHLATAKEAEQPTEFEKEIAAFGWWFTSAKLDVGWALDQLSSSLQLVHRTESMHLVLEHLAETSIKYPLQSVNCLRVIAESNREGWEIYASRNRIRKILEQGLQNPDATQEAERVIHYLGSRGFLDFRDLLQG